MPRGQNEAFKAQQGKGGFAASAEKAREAGRKGGRAKSMTMQDFKNKLQEKIAEEKKNGNETRSMADVICHNLCVDATKGDKKAIKLLLEILQFGEPKNIDITSGGERLPDIIIRQSDGRGIATTEQDIEDD